MYYFLGLERRAKKCVWIRLVWCKGRLTRMKERAPATLGCGAWAVNWGTDSPMVSPTKPVRVVEYDHDDEVRNLGYTASLTARSRTAETALTKLTRHGAKIFTTKPNLRACATAASASWRACSSRRRSTTSRSARQPWPRSERRSGAMAASSTRRPVRRQRLPVERARELAGVRRPGSASAFHGSDEGAAGSVSVDDHQLGLC